MQVGEAVESRSPLVYLRVVLHGARAEGIKLRVDAEVPLAQTHEVTNRFGLTDLGQTCRSLPLETAQRLLQVDAGHVERSQRHAAAARRATFENRGLLELEPFCRIARHGLLLLGCVGGGF